MLKPQLARRLSALDAAFLYLEKTEAPLHIGSVSVFDGVIEYADFARHIENRLPLIPRYLQKVVPDPFNLSHPTWETAPAFDIKNHVFEIELPSPGTEAELAALGGKLLTGMLDRNKPLWELYLVQGLSGGRSALVAKVHHCMVDGISGVDLMKVLFDISPKPAPLPKPPTAKAAALEMKDATRTFLDTILNNVQESAKILGEMQKGLLHLAQSFTNPQALAVLPNLAGVLPAVTTPPSLLPFNRPLSGEQLFAWSEFSFAEARAIRTAFDGTVNDVVLTVLSDAVGRYARQHGQDTTGRVVRFMVPVSLRQSEQRGALGNLISILPVEIPLDIEDLAERFAFVHQRTAMMKAARLAEGLGMMAAMFGMLPAPLQALVGALATTPVPPFNMVATNVPGPQVPLYILGRRLRALYPYVPIGYAIGCGCAILSYDQKLFFGLSADAAAMPDVAEFKQLLESSFANLRARAGVTEITDFKSQTSVASAKKKRRTASRKTTNQANASTRKTAKVANKAKTAVTTKSIMRSTTKKLAARSVKKG